MMRRARPLLGTIVEIAAEGDEGILSAAIDAAFAEVLRVHRLMSFHDPSSDVSRVNAAAPGAMVAIDPRTYHVMAFACELSDLSLGMFDITTASILVENDLLPEPAYPNAERSRATYRDFDLLPDHHVRWRKAGRIDLGGIAKGYAVDAAVTALQAAGATGGLVNAGGDLRCFGGAQPIHLRHPESPTQLLHIGWLENAALATSAGYFSAANGSAVDPLVDPKQQRCICWPGSVSVAAAQCMTADALTKVVALAPSTAPDLLDRFDAQAVVIDRQGGYSCGRQWLLQEVVA